MVSSIGSAVVEEKQQQIVVIEQVGCRGNATEATLQGVYVELRRMLKIAACLLFESPPHGARPGNNVDCRRCRCN